MAETAVQFLVENLSRIVIDYVKLIQGAEGDIKKLLEEAELLNAQLDDAAKRDSDSSVWKTLIQHIRKTVYRAEDVIDSLLVEAKLHYDKSKAARLVYVGYWGKVANHAKEIKDILQKVQELHQKIVAYSSRREDDPLKKVALEPEDTWLENDEVVGFDEAAKDVITRLVEGSNDLVIVPIVGMPGLGKTTLARKVYKDSKIEEEFFFKSWVYVGEKSGTKDIFLKILRDLDVDTTGYENKEVEKLVQVICGTVGEGAKCLIVLDDVWAPEVVDLVKKAFPKHNIGHRIMMTTREKDVATYANKFPHHLSFLPTNESFKLLGKRVFQDGSFPLELVKLGTSIAQKCNGVPLAVVVIAGALKGNMNKDDWAVIESRVDEYLIDSKNSKSCFKYVEVSYNRLPQQIKMCLLYCGIFPRGFEIPAWKVIRLWISEGLIATAEMAKNTREKTAGHYLNQLVNRSLLMVMQKSSDGKIKTFRLHDMIHEFCTTEAAKDQFFIEVSSSNHSDNTTTQDSDTCRRLSIQSSDLHNFISTLQVPEHVRSFLCFSSETKHIESVPNIECIHESFPLVRVWDVESFKFILAKSFYHLFHLRYISISGDFPFLPSQFGNFWNLQTLILNTTMPVLTFEIKADIWKMTQLRHLHTNVPAKLPSPSTKPAGRSSNLQTLSIVASDSCKKEVLAKACNLKKLSIQGRMAAFLDTNKGGINYLEKLKYLENLKLVNDGMNKGLHLPPTLAKLLGTLKKLTLSSTLFDWIEAKKLEQLKFLEVLKLKEKAFTGNSWKLEKAFSSLQFLWIERADFVSWEASNDHFPFLKQLVLISCDKLMAVPLKLADISSLQEMRLENTNEAAVKSAKEIESEKEKKQASNNIKFKLIVKESIKA